MLLRTARQHTKMASGCLLAVCCRNAVTDSGDDVLFVASSALHEARLGFLSRWVESQHLLFNHEKGGPGVHVNHTPRKCVFLQFLILIDFSLHLICLVKHIANCC